MRETVRLRLIAVPLKEPSLQERRPQQQIHHFDDLAHTAAGFLFELENWRGVCVLDESPQHDISNPAPRHRCGHCRRHDSLSLCTIDVYNFCAQRCVQRTGIRE